MVLVDTSVWIEMFRRPARIRIEDHVDFDDIVTCLPVIQEVLQGISDEVAHRRLRMSFLALPRVGDPVELDLHLEAADIYRRGRKRGLTLRSSVDCLIAASAMRRSG